MPGTSQLVLLPNVVVGVSDGTGLIWLCCGISCHFLSMENLILALEEVTKDKSPGVL